MKTAVAMGVREGLDGSRLGEMTQALAKAIRESGSGTPDPSVYERLDALEERIEMHHGHLSAHDTRLDRHRRRIRWLERLAHWHGWFRPDPSP